MSSCSALASPAFAAAAPAALALHARRTGRPRARAYDRDPGQVTADDIELTFLGTSSGAPSRSRNQQALAMFVSGSTWMFDCGEATQHRMLSTQTITPSTVTRIFVSHMHGDHIFGLPGLLCNMAATAGGGDDGEASSGPALKADSPIVVVGPQGLRSWLRAVLGNAYASLGTMQITIHELVGMQAMGRVGGRPLKPHCEVAAPLTSEVGGEDLRPSEEGVWAIPMGADEPAFTIEAIELDHTVPTVGWILTERPRPGKLNAEAVVPLLKAQDVPLSALRDFKRGVPIPMPDGSYLQPEDYVAPSTQRKLALLSDMRQLKVPASAEPRLRDATLLVHEATNACLGSDLARGAKPAAIERAARKHGHSTPQMAARFARRLGARHLMLTHFSPRYAGDASHSSRAMMNELRLLAEKADGGAMRGRVTTALDLMKVIVGIDGTLHVLPPGASTRGHGSRRQPSRPEQGPSQ